jgi:DNA-binding MarR family transcriptional regulator
MSLLLRPSQALPLWSAVTVAEVLADRPDLTTRQTAILLIVYLEPPPHTVRGLAMRLDVTKPVVTRALDTLGALGLLTRQRDPDDGRSVLVRRTAAGALYVEALGDAIVAAARGLAS